MMHKWSLPRPPPPPQESENDPTAGMKRRREELDGSDNDEDDLSSTSKHRSKKVSKRKADGTRTGTASGGTCSYCFNFYPTHLTRHMLNHCKARDMPKIKPVEIPSWYQCPYRDVCRTKTQYSREDAVRRHVRVRHPDMLEEFIEQRMVAKRRWNRTTRNKVVSPAKEEQEKSESVFMVKREHEEQSDNEDLMSDSGESNVSVSTDAEWKHDEGSSSSWHQQQQKDPSLSLSLSPDHPRPVQLPPSSIGTLQPAIWASSKKSISPTPSTSSSITYHSSPMFTSEAPSHSPVPALLPVSGSASRAYTFSSSPASSYPSSSLCRSSDVTLPVPRLPPSSFPYYNAESSPPKEAMPSISELGLLATSRLPPPSMISSRPLPALQSNGTKLDSSAILRFLAKE